MTGFLDSLLNDYRTQMERHRNRPFLKASMAACALAAVADGAPTLSERIRVDQILETLEALKIFDPHEGVELFNEYSRAILESPKEGREYALADVRNAAGDPETANLMVRMCLAVAEAKGEKSLVDQIEIVMLCSILGVEPKQAGLYTDRTPEDILEDPGKD
ncbi:MAG: TerB family tellurite resistance protein [Gammaproteobacteria bacterium]|nr:TerB family tellurite resistance protein [Gammaproteobacteria bacterium]